MIYYSSTAEKKFIEFFAEQLGNKNILRLLENNDVISQKDASEIGTFFWKMVDRSVELNETQECPWPEGYEFWSEKVLQSVAAFLKKSGYENALQEQPVSKSNPL